ncbi:hypothetical protein [Nostoc sp. FACHB-892]|nr:hypothetical protein [Nostoc sp. FACHB-892]
MPLEAFAGVDATSMTLLTGTPEAMGTHADYPSLFATFTPTNPVVKI